MRIITRRGWELPESAATPEHIALGRRAWLAGAAAIASVPAIARPAHAQLSKIPLTAPRNERFVAGRALTAEKDAATYNNYYEFDDGKDMWELAQKLPQDPWAIEITGMVEKPFKIGLDELLKKVQLEERIYRHRCVEAWAMTVPWTGFTLASLVKMAAPLSSAKYVEFQSLADKKYMVGVNQPWYPFPYTEGLTIEEAANDLSFLAVGMYGKKAPPQSGGPVRLLTPWKYGFKAAKAIVKVNFTDKRPKTFWEALQPAEYGFWANVNPDVSHPRWSQKNERILGTGERAPTQIYNGYGEFVASLYTNLGKEKLFM